MVSGDTSFFSKTNCLLYSLRKTNCAAVCRGDVYLFLLPSIRVRSLPNTASVLLPTPMLPAQSFYVHPGFLLILRQKPQKQYGSDSYYGNMELNNVTKYN